MRGAVIHFRVVLLAHILIASEAALTEEGEGNAQPHDQDERSKFC
jgi:hypothetical protein